MRLQHTLTPCNTPSHGLAASLRFQTLTPLADGLSHAHHVHGVRAGTALRRRAHEQHTWKPAFKDEPIPHVPLAEQIQRRCKHRDAYRAPLEQRHDRHLPAPYIHIHIHIHTSQSIFAGAQKISRPLPTLTSSLTLSTLTLSPPTFSILTLHPLTRSWLAGSRHLVGKQDKGGMLSQIMKRVVRVHLSQLCQRPRCWACPVRAHAHRPLLVTGLAHCDEAGTMPCACALAHCACCTCMPPDSVQEGGERDLGKSDAS